METWEAEVADTLAELLDPPLHRPLFPPGDGARQGRTYRAQYVPCPGERCADPLCPDFPIHGYRHGRDLGGITTMVNGIIADDYTITVDAHDHAGDHISPMVNAFDAAVRKAADAALEEHVRSIFRSTHVD